MYHETAEYQEWLISQPTDAQYQEWQLKSGWVDIVCGGLTDSFGFEPEATHCDSSVGLMCQFHHYQHEGEHSFECLFDADRIKVVAGSVYEAKAIASGYFSTEWQNISVHQIS